MSYKTVDRAYAIFFVASSLAILQVFRVFRHASIVHQYRGIQYTPTRTASIIYFGNNVLESTVMAFLLAAALITLLAGIFQTYLLWRE